MSIYDNPDTTNTELLCHALGWQGGTVHQVAESTGLTVTQIIDGNRYDVAHLRSNGWTAIRTCGLEYLKSKIFPARQGDLAFWMGVAHGQENKENGLN